MEKLMFICEQACLSWQLVLTGGIIVTSAIIFLLGMLKKVVFDKIKNKLLRKVALSFSSVILVFPFTAIYIVSNNIPFDYYWWACGGAAIATVITYWLYENTGLRNLIYLIGKITVGKCVAVLYEAFTEKKSNAETKTEFVSVTADLQTTVKEEVAKTIKTNATTDDKLKDL